jgi:hypothetical protein
VSIYVSDFKAAGGWTVVHEEAAHQGTIQPTDVVFSKTPDGTPDFRMLLVTCPVCQAVSTHPVGGGAVPPQVQEMFLRTLLRPTDCPCGNLPAGRPLLLTIAHLKTHADQMDHTGRWIVNSGSFQP